MNKKHFKVRFLNPNIGPLFFEEGYHNNYTDEELVAWFLEKQEKMGWSKISDIEIKERVQNDSHIERIDLVMKIIKPRKFKPGEVVRATFFLPLPKKEVAPPMKPEQEYPIKAIIYDSLGNQHIGLGIESKYNFIRSYETGEKLREGDRIHWVHPGRLEIVESKTCDAAQFIKEDCQ